MKNVEQSFFGGLINDNDNEDCVIVTLAGCSSGGESLPSPHGESGKVLKNQNQSGVHKITCQVCKTRFMSRSALFRHLEETGHATATVAEAPSKKGKKGQKKDFR
jgi:hypothetical protein